MYVILGMVYMFPCIMMSSVPWYTTDVSLNYLWPATLLMGVLTVLASAERGAMLRKWYHYVLLILLGFFAGWSNEAFAVPLSGALFFYMIIRKSRMRGAMWCMTIALWFGTAMLVFAPGTLQRAMHHTDQGISQVVIMFFECYSNVKFIWILFATMLILKIIKKISIKDFLRENFVCSLIFGIGLIFSIYAHTYSHSLTCIELMSMILLAKLLLPYVRSLHEKKYLATLFVIIVAAFGAHQFCVCKANHLLRANYQITTQRYAASPDGLYVYDKIELPRLIRPYAYNYLMLLSPSSYAAPEFSIVHGQCGQLPMALTKREYHGLVEAPEDFFVPENRVPGSAKLFNGDCFYFTPLDSIGSPDVKVVAHFDTPDFTQNMSIGRKLVYAILGNKKAPKQLKSYVIDTRRGKYFVADKIMSVPSSIEIED